MDRTSFMAANGYVVLPSRLQQYGFTREYGMTSQTFVMATPSLAPRWDNLLFPLSWEVWVAVIAALVVLAGVLKMVGVSVVIVFGEVCVCVCFWFRFFLFFSSFFYVCMRVCVYM